MTVQDVVKLIYQNEFAGGHMITNEKVALDRLVIEMESMTCRVKPLLFDDIGNHLCRLNLCSLPEGIQATTINRFFTLTANQHQGKIGTFEDKIMYVLDALKSGLCDLNPMALEELIQTLKSQGYPAVHHSESYRAAYHPAYRVISQVFSYYFNLFLEIDQRLQNQERVLLAIDGNCGSGKSTLAKLLQAVYQAPVVHMDDFYLPAALRTADRLNQPGGNVHYERFEEEVLRHISTGKDFIYRGFDCQSQSFKSGQTYSSSPLWIIEGSYCHHPKLETYYDLKIFLKTGSEIQKERILKRNGREVYKRFIEAWIPLENRYFQHLCIEAKSDMIFDTSSLENMLLL